jgi:hypothetical protein
MQYKVSKLSSNKYTQPTVSFTYCPLFHKSSHQITLNNLQVSSCQLYQHSDEHSVGLKCVRASTVTRREQALKLATTDLTHIHTFYAIVRPHKYTLLIHVMANLSLSTTELTIKDVKTVLILIY